MRSIFSFTAVALALFISVPAIAESDIPDLKGTWTMRAQAVVHHKKPEPKAHTDVKTGHADIEITIRIDKQDGFRFSGTKESAKMKEKISGVIGFDNKTVYMVDDDAMMFCRLISKDKMEYIYLRSTHDFSAAGRAILTRQR